MIYGVRRLSAGILLSAVVLIYPAAGIAADALSAARDYPALTILLITGYADQRERAHGLDAVIHDVISKPFSVATLRGAVNEALTVGTRS